LKTTVVPARWPLASLLQPLLETAVERLGLGDELHEVVLVADAIEADDRGWIRLVQAGQGWSLSLWFHPDQVLCDRPGHGAARREAQDWQLGPVPAGDEPPTPDEFSAPNAQRFIYQQLLLVGDVLAGRLVPGEVPGSLVEAFQEAWLVSVDGRLQREGLPHLSAGERRTSFLRLFGPAGVLTPSHWSIFNRLWEGTLATQSEVLAKVRLLPPLSRRPRS